MKGTDLTDKMIGAAEQYIMLRRVGGGDKPDDNQAVVMPFKQLVALVAEYGAIRAMSVTRGGSVEEPGEVYLTGRE